MAVTFSDLHTEQGLKTLEDYLAGKTYISGDQLTIDDVKVYAAVLEKPGDGCPNASKWNLLLLELMVAMLMILIFSLMKLKMIKKLLRRGKETKKPKESGKSSVL